MNRTAVMRAALWETAFWNVIGSLSFIFPESLGQIFGLPAPAPHLYTWFIAFIIDLFAVTYAWLARQPEIDRPLVVVAALGKTGLFAIVFACWLLEELPGRGAALASVDLAFAVIFFWWLSGERSASSAVPQRFQQSSRSTVARM